ncbi:uncharacterized protein J3R85_005097 [Psidium guajava]|nr:uncharacterized protein J3R85_005097 [Psidium guajava]
MGEEIELAHRFGEDLRTEPLRLAAAAVHELSTDDPLEEAREVLDVDSGSELAAGGEVVGYPSLEEDRLELGAGGVDCGGVGGGAAVNDAKVGLYGLKVVHGGSGSDGGGERSCGRGGGGEADEVL